MSFYAKSFQYANNYSLLINLSLELYLFRVNRDFIKGKIQILIKSVIIQIFEQKNRWKEMSSKGLGKQLTLDLIFTKTKSDSLPNIKNLNLWGNDLEDLSLLEQMPNLEVVSLSVNRISSLKDFAKCPKLQELYLRKNNIMDLSEIVHLIKLPNLKVLWLHDNPCAQVENYREIVIKHLPNLMKLDNNVVSGEDKLNSQKITTNYVADYIHHHIKSEEKINHHNNSVFNVEETPKLSENHKLINKNKTNYVPEEKLIQKKPERQNREERYSGREKEKQTMVQAHMPPTQVSSSHQNKNQYNNQGNKQEERNKNQYYNQGNKQEERNKNQYHNQSNKQQERNKNILMAVLALLPELDQSSLQIVKMQIEKYTHPN